MIAVIVVVITYFEIYHIRTIYFISKPVKTVFIQYVKDS